MCESMVLKDREEKKTSVAINVNVIVSLLGLTSGGWCVVWNLRKAEMKGKVEVR